MSLSFDALLSRLAIQKLPKPGARLELEPLAGSADALAVAQLAGRGRMLVVITANPLGNRQLAAPNTVLEGDDLLQQQQGSLGETLNKQPGVSSSYFGPGASRPVIRGLDGDRIRILRNGVGALDASSLSYDHAVPLDPVNVERVEIVRGPAALLYGGNAIGGVVNTFDNRIPDAPVQGIHGAGELRYGGADTTRSSAGKLEAGDGRFALHLDANSRQFNDLRIPGYARSSKVRDADLTGFLFISPPQQRQRWRHLWPVNLPPCARSLLGAR
mgnify:CR=1 FL=1